jgi:hypothetical protein
MFKKVILFFLLTYTYAILRYQLGKDLWGWYDYFFSLNKSISWTAGTMLALTLISDKNLEIINMKRKDLGVLGYLLALIHIIFSISLLNPQYYPSFYTHNVINVNGWISISLGIASISFFSLALMGSLSILKQSFIKLGKWGIVVNFLHVVNIGFLKWFPISDWSMNLPPITLLFSIELILIFVIRLLIMKKQL